MQDGRRVMSVDEQSTSSKNSSKSSRSGPNHVAMRLARCIIESQTGTMQKFSKMAKLMTKLRDRLATGEHMNDDATTTLICLSTEMMKTLFLTPDHDHTHEPLKRTVPLMFVLLCASKNNRDHLERRGRASLHSWTMDTESMHVIDVTEKMSVWDRLADVDKPPPEEEDEPQEQPQKKQKTGTAEEIAKQIEAEEAEEEAKREAKRKAEAWKKALKISDKNIADAMMRLACQTLKSATESEMEKYAHVFFRASAREMTASLLMQGGDTDVCTLGSSSLASMSTLQRDEQLLTIAQGAESEAGQQIARDLNLSFTLPPSHIGIRRTLLITRERSTRAGVDYPALVQRSHEVAMAGCEWVWLNSASNVERMCALLAGVAVWTTTEGDDPIRKCNAFGGRVQLPFFETAHPKPRLQRITLIPQYGRWVLYRISESDGEPRIIYSQKGFIGLCNCVLQLVDALKKEKKSAAG